MGNSKRQEQIPLMYKPCSEYRKKLYEVIKKNNWKELCRIVEEEANYAEDIFQPNPETDWNILHYVINGHPSDEEAAMTIEFFFGYIKDHQFATNRHDALFDFVNHMSDKGGVKTTPLRMALIKKFYKVVKTLLHNNADVSLKIQSVLNEDCQNLVLELYDKGIDLECNLCDVKNQNWWSVKCEYGYITGWESKNDSINDKYREMSRLAQTLVLSREQRTNLMMHPLVQMFVKDKYTKYSFLIKVSMIYHIIWSIMSATYIMCINTVVTMEETNFTNVAPNIALNGTRVETNIANLCRALKLSKASDFPCDGWFSRLFVVFLIVSLVKEIVEVCICPGKLYYWNQYENKGQWTALIIPVCSLIILFFPNWSLVVPMLWIFVIYIINGILLFKNVVGVPTKNNIYQLNDMDNYVILAAAVCYYILSSNGLCSRVWYASMLVYFVFPCPFLAWLIAKNKNRSNINKIMHRWKLGNYLLQFSSITIQMGLIAYTPFVETGTHAPIASFICAVGIAASLFLVQGQLTKTESYGVYNQMLMKGFKILVPFLFTFFPILAAYFVIFILLLPSNPNFSLNNGLGLGKIVAMLTGDLGFDDIFSANDIPFIISANIALILFAVTVVLLLQNLLIGVTVNDLEKLQRNATAAHVANRIEVIYLIEKLMMWEPVLYLLGKVQLNEFVIESLCVRELGFWDNPQVQMYEAVPIQDPETMQNTPITVNSTTEDHRTTIKFCTLPKSIRDGILEKEDVYMKNFLRKVIQPRAQQT